MSSRNIAVRKDVYEALEREKRPGESFTKALLRLLNQRGPLDDVVGTWPEHVPPTERRLLQAWRGPISVRRR